MVNTDWFLVFIPISDQNVLLGMLDREQNLGSACKMFTTREKVPANTKQSFNTNSAAWKFCKWL